MKRFVSALLLIALLFSLSACGKQEEVAEFYYPRSEFIPASEYGVIAPETRTITGSRGLNYNLRLYLDGPASDQYITPFPEGVYLLSTKVAKDQLIVFLSPEFAQLEDMDLTLACACLAQTCFKLTGASQVTIKSENSEKRISITLAKDSFTLLDVPSAYETTP